MKKKSNGTLVGILIGIIMMLLVIVGLFATGTIKLKSTITNDNKQNSDNNETIVDNNKNNNQKQPEDNNIVITGIYKKEEKNENSYYKSTVNIINSTNSTIDFSISTVHGKDEENVNIGEVKGIAKKVAENEYIFEENIDGNTNKITFKFSNKGTKQYLTIDESYYNDINPYGGHGVYFAAEYEKE